jgi:SPP1 gp7 family putative phage head morphogenesis protein
MPTAAALPRLETRRAFERAALTRLQYAHELALEAHIAHALAAIGRHSAKSYRNGGNVTNVADIRHSLARVMRPSLVTTARAFAELVTHHPKAAHNFSHKAFDDIDSSIRDFMNEHTAEAVVGISDSTREAILNAIRRGEDENLSVEEIARLIVDVTSGEIGLARARRIARTETHAAAMYGQQAAAEASPLDFSKVWLATEDARTRPDHAEANGQTVALDEMFQVGDAELLYPGDFNAPPEQIINCRCVALYEPAAIGEEA